MNREICFDTETTGLDPLDGDRLLEIGCIELIDGKRTGKYFHEIINPERDTNQNPSTEHVGKTCVFPNPEIPRLTFSFTMVYEASTGLWAVSDPLGTPSSQLEGLP